MTTATQERVDESGGTGVVIELDGVREARARRATTGRQVQPQQLHRPRRAQLERRQIHPELGRRGRGPARCADSSPATLHGGRLTRRGRLVVTVVWLALAAIAALLIVRPIASSGTPEATASIQIKAGDTLWEVARGVDPQADPREIVDDIVAINGLESVGDIRPGDVLRIPRNG